ncbi:fungal-specific transcription factor domain-containing protein [Poronia punctata]|nr:fungal-specific transcription factor domain-containing protein [Poronia punctata]
MLPVPLKALFILMAMVHAMHKLPSGTEKQVLVRARSAIAYWSYQVVRSLNEDIAQEEKRASDGTMTSVMMLLWADQQIQPSARWRFHYNGFIKMTQLRGGIEKLWNENPHLRIGIMTTVVIEIFANATSPSNDQLLELTHPLNFDFFRSVWGDGSLPVYIGSICPPALLFEVVEVNRLRAASHLYPNNYNHQSQSQSQSQSQFDDLEAQAQETLSRILSFSPEALANLHGKNERTRAHWLLIGRVHQSAITLYCILSLQDVGLLPDNTAGFKSIVAVHYDRLLINLREGLRHDNFRNCLLWPLVVAGVGAGTNGSAFERDFVAGELAAAVKEMGTAAPMLAREVLKRFWSEGKMRWDECFDQPYLFIM